MTDSNAVSANASDSVPNDEDVLEPPNTKHEKTAIHKTQQTHGRVWQFCGDQLPRIFLVLALIVQFLILGFLVVLSMTQTAYLARLTPADVPVVDGVEQHYGIWYVSEFVKFLVGTPSLAFIGGLILIIVALCAFSSILRHVPKRVVFIALLVYVAVAQLAWIAAMNTQDYYYPDSLSLSQLATAFNNNDQAAFAQDACSSGTNQCDYRVTSSYLYLHYYPFQAGPALWFALVFKVFGTNNFIAFQMINAAFITVMVGCLWYLGKQMGLKRQGLNAFALLTVTCVPLLMLAAFVYTNAVGFAFVIMGAAVIARALHIHNPWGCAAAIVAGFALCSVGVMFKTTYIIIVIAVIIAFIFAVWKSRRYWQLPLGVVLTYVVTKVSDIPVRMFEKVAGYSLGDGMPMSSWILLGIDTQAPALEGAPAGLAPGWWTSKTVEIYNEANGDSAAQSAMISAELHERLAAFASDPSYAKSYFIQKLSSEWTDPTFMTRYYSEVSESGTSFSGTLASLLSKGPTSVFFRFLNVMQSAVYLLAFIGVAALAVQLIRRGWKNLKQQEVFGIALLCASFIGGFLCYILWEAKGIYTLPFYLLLLPLAAKGVEYVMQLTNKVWLKLKHCVPGRTHAV